MEILIFAGSDFYPRGGMHDLAGVLAGLPDALTAQPVADLVAGRKTDESHPDWVQAACIDGGKADILRLWNVRVVESAARPPFVGQLADAEAAAPVALPSWAHEDEREWVVLVPGKPR